MDRPQGVPRRQPANKSVSLRHTAAAEPSTTAALDPRSSALTSDSERANPPSSPSPPLVLTKQSSGESSDAGKWFDSANHTIRPSNHNTYVDNEPPFVLRNDSSASTTPPDGTESAAPGPSAAMPFRPGLRRLPTDGSNDEFRSVIDDLTVANKRLKQKLKRYEKLYDAHLQNEKLFEVRFHGLPDHKKKELEETLRKFAVGLDEAGNTVNFPATLQEQNTASNTSRPTDPGYVSMSASGQNSTSAPSGNDGDGRSMTKSQYNQQQKNIHSYLHDIPAGLLPRQSVPMSENSKKKLVVRRLEQVFAGRHQMSDNRQQPIQQEEVAQSAARDDREARQATGRSSAEGVREALIMPMALDADEMQGIATNSSAVAGEHANESSRSPDQRPTRPLDLDPSRAQVPAENVKYIRHLGFAVGDVTSTQPPEDGQGWVYLNLLINMAQLHTINVTPDFVKDALAEYSTKFELSHDGRKVRWKGGNELTLNSDSSSEHLSGNSQYDATGSGSRSISKRSKTDPNASTDSMELDSKGRHTHRPGKGKGRDKFAYTPIFFHRPSSEEDDDIFEGGLTSSSNSPYLEQQRGDSTGFASSGVRSSSSRKKRDDGPMIFYQNANFCTDLSGNRTDMLPGMPVNTYNSVTNQPIGATLASQDAGKNLTGIGEPRGPMHTSPMGQDPKEGEGVVISSEEDSGFSLPDLRRNDSSDSSASAVKFEASGLGGVQPEDNFAIKVRRSQTRGESSSSVRSKSKRSRLYPKKILEALGTKEAPEGGHDQFSPTIKESIISTSQKKLPNSELPQPSYLPFDSTSSGDVDSDLESDVSSNPSASSSSADPVAAETPEISYISPMHPAHYGNRQEHSSSDNGSDSSINFLGPPPQKADVVAILGHEADDHSDFAERIAEDIPAGSSAATAGGGSGFNSPVDLASAERDDGSTRKPQERLRASASPTSPAAHLKRGRTSDSITAALQEPSKSRKMQGERTVRGSKSPEI